MKNRAFLTVALIMPVVFLLGFSAWAVPGLINYQGKLTDANGDSLNGVYTMRFYLSRQETGGSFIWGEQQVKTITNGIYNVQLGAVNTLNANLFDNEFLYLEVWIYKSGTGWEIFSPRQRLTSTAYSMKAADADTLDGYDSTDLAATNHTHNGEDITSGIIDKTYIDQAITRDSELATHAAAPSVHHSKTTSFSEMTDMATDAQIPDNITVNYAKNSDKVDGKHASEFGDGHSLDAVDGNPVNAVYVDNVGNVGIGTTNPLSELHIYENKNGFVGLRIDNPNTGSSSSEGIYFKNEDGAVAGIRLFDDGFATYPSQMVIFNNRLGGTISFNTQGVKKMTLNNSGNVGIGLETASEKLVVNGNIKAHGKVIYDTPHTHYFMVPGEGFVPGSNVNYANTYGMGGAYINSGSGALVAPVHIPHGAVVTELKVFFNDNSESNMTVYFEFVNLTSGAFYRQASVTSSGISGYGSKTDTCSHTINKTSRGYHIYAWSDAWDGNNLKIMGALLTYTINEAP